MNTSIFKPELIHPMIVHFPVACLSLGVLTRFLYFALKGKGLFANFLFTSRLLMVFGVITGWGAVLSGNLASDIVEKSLCHQAMVDEHENFAIIASVLFSAFLALDFVIERKMKDLIPLWLQNLLIFAVLFSGFGVLLAAGHRGASLVYLQGAAVQIPSPSQCDAIKKLE